MKSKKALNATTVPSLKNVIDDLYQRTRKVSMGKKEVGKHIAQRLHLLWLLEKRYTLQLRSSSASLKYVAKGNREHHQSHIDEEAVAISG